MDLKHIPMIIFGTGATSREAFHLVQNMNENSKDVFYDILGFVAENEMEKEEFSYNGKRTVTTDLEFEEFSKSFDELAVIISIGTPRIKKIIFDRISQIKNLVFPNIISPKALIKEGAIIGEGNVFMENIVIGIDDKIGFFNLINTGAVIGHDTVVGDFNVINPVSSISGNVTIGNLNLIGTGANVLQSLKIGNNSVIGAGAVLTKNLEDNKTVIGIPAGEMNKDE